MSAAPVAVQSAGMVSPVGLSAPASCAAIRARISNPSETRCTDSHDEWIVAHQVPFERPWRGLARLTRMAVSAIEECLEPVGPIDWPQLPVLLCSSERNRPGRVDGIDDRLLVDIAQQLGVAFSLESALFCHGRTGIAVALMHARKLIYQLGIERVLVVTTDSLVTRRTLAHFEKNHRLLTPANSNGFMAGEGASAFLVGRPTGPRQLVCTGIGFGVEPAHIDSGEPLRGDGLLHAHTVALAESGRSMDDVDYRVSDLGGEHYYFKESHFAFTRLRHKATDTELWHPAQCTGAGGAALGGVCLAVAHAALQRGYAPGATALLHFSDDAGQRASIVCTGC